MENIYAPIVSNLDYDFSGQAVGINVMKNILLIIILLALSSSFVCCSSSADSVKSQPKEIEKRVDLDDKS